MRLITRVVGPIIVLVFTAVAGVADTHVRFHAILDRADFEEAMEFFRDNLEPQFYDTSLTHPRTWAPRRRGKSLEIFVHDWVLLGRGDINDDGVVDRFYYFDHPAFCGSIGCELWIVDGRQGANEILCATYAYTDEGDDTVKITDRVTVNGFHELETPALVYWHGSECDLDDPKTRNEEHLRSRDPLRR